MLEECASDAAEAADNDAGLLQEVAFKVGDGVNPCHRRSQGICDLKSCVQ